MTRARIFVGTAFAAALAVAAAVAPAMGAEDGRTAPKPRRGAAAVMSGIGSFTPSSADPRLAALLARAGATSTGFRFTPSGERASRAVTVSVAARTSRGPVASERIAAETPAATAIAPIAYNLGVSVGWKRFALSGDLAKVDIAGQPGSRESADVGLSYTGRAFSGRVQAEATRPAANEPSLVAEPQSVAVDLGGAYRLTRNLDLTAGVRYKSERERLAQPTDTRRDSQSVYVGTAFRF